jgi:hypothetical protein
MVNNVQELRNILFSNLHYGRIIKVKKEFVENGPRTGTEGQAE